jgi:ribosome modulation factor
MTAAFDWCCSERSHARSRRLKNPTFVREERGDRAGIARRLALLCPVTLLQTRSRWGLRPAPSGYSRRNSNRPRPLYAADVAKCAESASCLTAQEVSGKSAQAFDTTQAVVPAGPMERGV